MKISTKGRYGLRAMIQLAVSSNENFISLSVIAKEQDISVNYLEHAFSTLKKSGLVKSIAGSHGGYKLGRDAKDITIHEILFILEGDLSIIDPIDLNEESDIQLILRQNVWDPINNEINNITKSTNLQDMAAEAAIKWNI